MSAGEHFGHQSLDVVRHLSQDWGFEYLTASSKEEFEKVYGRFVIPELTDKPMVFEVFTQVEDEDKALVALSSIEATTGSAWKSEAGSEESSGTESN